MTRNGRVSALIKINNRDQLTNFHVFQAFPDVAAQSDRFRIFLAGRAVLIGGTSASSPAFAGIVALLNDVRLSNNQKPLGFLNPLLYSKGVSGFNDITIGHNSGCGTTGFNVSSFPQKKEAMTNHKYVGYNGMGSRSVKNSQRKNIQLISNNHLNSDRSRNTKLREAQRVDILGYDPVDLQMHCWHTERNCINTGVKVEFTICAFAF